MSNLQKKVVEELRNVYPELQQETSLPETLDCWMMIMPPCTGMELHFMEKIVW